MRHNAKVDRNHAEVVAALRKCSASVHSLAREGSGMPDLLVGFAGQTLLMEVKDGRLPPSARRLTPDQERWHAEWRGGPVYIITDVSEALAALNGPA